MRGKDIQGLAMFFVEGFLAAFAIVDADGALQAVNLQIAKGFATEVIDYTRRRLQRHTVTSGQRTVGNGGRNRTALFALQMEGRGWGADVVEVP